MKKAVFSILFLVVLLAVGVIAEAQQPTKIPQVGYLNGGLLSGIAGRIEAFRQGLRELNYVEGKNIVIDWRSAEGQGDRLPALAAELLRRKVDIIVTAGGNPTRAAKAATSTIPIVMTNDGDPVGDGLVASLARPGGNITGLSTFSPELSGKRLEILREVIPKFSRVAVLGTRGTPDTPGSPALRELEPAAKAFGVKLQYLYVQNPKDIETAFRAASKGRADAVLTVGNPILASQRTQLAEFAAKNRLPTIYHQSFYVEAGGLMFYGVNQLELDRRAAIYVDKILKGAKPAELPVEQPTKFEFIINLKAAKQIGLTIPNRVLERADKVIK
jgi:putative ABC transport system substrate-binding protein